MKIAISLDTNKNLESIVAQHFGRCPFFAILDVEQGKVQKIDVIENPFYSSHQPGQVPGFINDQKVNVIISGGMGRRAVQFFQQYNIDTASGASGTIEEALNDYFTGKLSTAVPCKQSEEHHKQGWHH